MKNNKIKRLINIDEKDGAANSILRLKKRYNYLKSKAFKDHKSNEMKYIEYHLRKLQKLST